MMICDLLSGNSIVSLDDSPPLPPNPLSGNSIVSLNDSPPLPLNPTRALMPFKEPIRSILNFGIKYLSTFTKYKETSTERTVKSLSHRWSCIQKATSSFCSCLGQVEGLNQSGMTHQDKFEKAKILYQSIEKCNFQFEHCWNLLKDQPKWISHATKDVPKERKTVAPSPSPSPSPTTTPSPTRNVIENEVIELDRPMGRKAEKKKRKAQGRQAEDIIQIRKMKYTLLEESRVQEKEFYRLKAEKIEYDRKADQED
ncbi:hypothetical protein M8C21_011827 [Ambrosia artemisiifolia]|uniref:No apical meristem-associated C-terminal domain-containing protein n=1 Tax=Ambrosia artemisiifolia TaxID=4212 RepID=A0AAD5C6W5_AMBAR|nr:hypothetical protein M8C21_011827 [Ambrosia artemisiifolia]